MAKQFNCGCEVIHAQIVESVGPKMPQMQEFNNIAALFKMFADTTRARILFALEQNELCVCDLAALLGMTKSAISHQLKSLRMSNLVKYRREGQVVYYSLADDHVKQILDMGFEHINE